MTEQNPGVLTLARAIEPQWWPAGQPLPADPTYPSVEIARRALDLGDGPQPSSVIDNLLADIADFIHLGLDHPVSGVCHGDNDGCQGGPGEAACSAADDVLDFLNLDEIEDGDR